MLSASRAADDPNPAPAAAEASVPAGVEEDDEVEVEPAAVVVVADPVLPGPVSESHLRFLRCCAGC